MAASTSLSTSPTVAAGRRPALPLVVALLAVVLLVVSCGAEDELGGAPVSSSPSTSSTSTSPPTASTPATQAAPTSSTSTSEATTAETPATSSAAGAGAGLSCELVERRSNGGLERPELLETSGLAASRRHPGVLWATNDSGQRSGIYAIDEEGGDLGFFALTENGAERSTVDVEDLAIADDILYLADIGDNGRRRDTVAIHLLAEPDPGQDGEVDLLATIEVRYPDGPTDAEALIVDPDRNELVILSKDLDDPSGPTRLYVVPLPSADAPTGGTVEAIPAGSLDVAALTATSDGFSFSTLLFPGSVTGADLSPAGDLVALRTYGSVWLFRHRPGQSVADSLTTSEPCETGSVTEAQGETVAFVPGSEPGTVRYVTVSEGSAPPVNATTAIVTG